MANVVRQHWKQEQRWMDALVPNALSVSCIDRFSRKVPAVYEIASMGDRQLLWGIASRAVAEIRVDGTTIPLDHGVFAVVGDEIHPQRVDARLTDGNVVNITLPQPPHRTSRDAS